MNKLINNFHRNLINSLSRLNKKIISNSNQSNLKHIPPMSQKYFSYLSKNNQYQRKNALNIKINNTLNEYYCGNSIIKTNNKNFCSFSGISSKLKIIIMHSFLYYSSYSII